ncbi:Amino acid transporter transmembrane domain-containing protein [Caenorhabditis elegans]|uniref:Amino acid transporter transmembrane domain-containing protein n=1 Tax=Caenorhabditis elegans TaxID=6239 RepID=Q9N321_CAEEL|nr:Amino acid transporter transmembrane domain-containing protein [Caenorhabditis elegans]CCD71148.1 Amino acid transporter transmembrane domain-containing protein [Caenorhabditis elegans]|eukprot:NP_501467.3 Uncharacterized protein CELE_Y59H11AR.4 [Caenorhabditis elegans]
MENGYSWYIAVIFTFGETAGSGLVALPSAMQSLGFMGGTITLIVMCLITYYTATLLGNNWIIMKTRWSEYSEHCRNPYPEMAHKALGTWMGMTTNFCTYFTVFGGTAVFSLLAAKTLAEVLNGFGIGATMCTTLITVGLILWPFVMLKSPAHFWQVSIVATISTVTAVALILFGYFLDAKGCYPHSSYPDFTPTAASNSLATIIFAYGGHPCIPTIVHDMKTPQHYFRCFLLSYIALFLLYTPVSLFGFWIYGDSVSDSIISSIQNDSLRRGISILIAVHVFFSVLIIVNPLLQASEHLFRVKHEFGIGRFIIRSIVFWIIIFSAASVPNFGVVVNLVGGSTLPLLVLIFPPLFAMCLEVRQKLEDDGAKEEFSLKSIWKYHPKPRLLLDIFIYVLGTYVMVHSTYHSLSSKFFSENPSTRSCFSTWFSSSYNVQNLTMTSSSHSTHFQCCGAFKNISLTGRSCF